MAVKVRAVRSFVDGRHGIVEDGAVLSLPDGVDWLEVGLVEKVEDASSKPRKRSGGSRNKRGSKGVAAG